MSTTTSLDITQLLFYVAISIPLCIIIKRFIELFLSYQKVKHIPGSWQLFFSFIKIPVIAPYYYIGNHVELHQVQKEIGDKETRTFRMSVPNENTIMFSDPQLLKEIFVTKASYFIKPKETYEILNLFGPNIVTAPDNEEWKKHHKICAPAFTVKSLEYMCHIAVESTDLLFETKWNKECKKHENGFELDLSDYSDVTLDILGKAGFGINFGIFSEDAEGKRFRKAMETVLMGGLIIRSFIPNTTLLNITNKCTGMDKEIEIVSNTLDRVIEERHLEIEENKEKERNDLLSLLVEANFQEKGLLTNVELKSNSFIFALAGHETTSTLLQWTTYELAKHPEIQEKARKEVKEIIGSRKPSPEDYPKLNYIHATLMESLRMHPPVTAVAKETKKDVMIGKFFLPKGTQVTGNIYSANMNENVWEKATEYMPERFIDFNYRQQLQHDFTWVPFSIGNRRCIGYQFAQMEGCMMLSRMLQSFEFVLLNDETKESDRVGHISTVTTRPHNLKVMVRPIN